MSHQRRIKLRFVNAISKRKISMKSSHLAFIIFLALAFIIPWISWAYMAKTGFNLLLFYTGAFCSVGGIVAIAIEEGKAGLQTRLKAIRISAPISGWVIAILFPFVWMPLSYFLFGLLFTPSNTNPIVPENLSALFSTHILWLLSTGPLSEEFGWRGYLLPKLMKRFSFVSSNILLGFIWAIWHLPIMFQKWTSSPVSAGYFVVGVICFAFVIGLVFVLSHGNLLLCILFHWTINAAQEIMGGIFPGTDLSNQNVHLFSTAILAILTLLILLRYKQQLGMRLDERWKSR